ncbi:hypothetical protein MPDQ_003419 [Monascus purpureus]|uniref:Uncharacterized protein n=1 Tax=Monascus purpureus TaxID=5098 RepID=A0A507QN78_MONPU|nr:hypothetical protein MPDQ_003419 [Monascus purpureus]BDD58466.1 hypothetical protein MAP00_003744 [Monascus purpureus]
MFDFEDDDASRREKSYTTVTQLPPFIDPKQPPTKKAPFSAILGHQFVHTVEVILPEGTYNKLKNTLHGGVKNPQYARVFMSLSSLLEGEFFNRYIKTGNILMISEGRSGSDNVFMLSNGILKLELGKELFERTGLTGKPIRSGGRKHAKERYLVQLNLRLPSMLHGKKGFERIVWAFKNVLNQSVAWLFCDIESETGKITDDIPLKMHQPQEIQCDPIATHRPNFLVPPLEKMDINENTPEEDLRENCDTLCEWLAMVSLDSPRLSADDSIDPYLSRYQVPCVEDAAATNLISLKWHGLISPKWIVKLFVLLLKETAKISTSPEWLALASAALGRDAVEGKDGYTILALPAAGQSHAGDNQGHTPPGAAEAVFEETTRKRAPQRVLCWEYVGASMLT